MNTDKLTPAERALSYRKAAAMARQNAKTHQAMAKLYPAEADKYLQLAADALDRNEHYGRRADALMEIARSEHAAA